MVNGFQQCSDVAHPLKLIQKIQIEKTKGGSGLKILWLPFWNEQIIVRLVNLGMPGFSEYSEWTPSSPNMKW